MRTKVVGLLVGVGVGFVLGWSRLTDPSVIRSMLLLREADVFLLMGSAVLVAAVGSRALRAARLRALVTGEPIAWSSERPRTRHFVGSLLFGAGWCVAGTCPGPAAAMVGEGNGTGLIVATGLFLGVSLQAAFERWRTDERAPRELPDAAGL